MSEEETWHPRHLIIGVSIFLEILGVGSFALRIWARKLSKATFWWDDYVMAAGLFLASIPGICNLVGLRFGLGKHASQISEKDTQNFLIIFYVLQMGHVSTLPTVKISVLFFYYRIFPGKTFRWAVYGIGTCLLLFLISSWLVTIFQSTPIHSFWQPQVPHHSINQVKYYLAQGSLNFVLDLAVVVMPIPILVRLQIPRHQKVGLVILFLLGGLACAVALGRLVSLNQVDFEDITWTNVSPGLWSSAEVETLVLSGNLLLMKPLFLKAAAMLGFRIRHPQVTDEESNNILEMSEPKSNLTDMSSRETQARFTNSVVGQRASQDEEGRMSKEDLPGNRILVEMDLEQNVHDLGTATPRRFRSP